MNLESAGRLLLEYSYLSVSRITLLVRRSARTSFRNKIIIIAIAHRPRAGVIVLIAMAGSCVSRHCVLGFCILLLICDWTCISGVYNARFFILSYTKIQPRGERGERVRRIRSSIRVAGQSCRVVRL